MTESNVEISEQKTPVNLVSPERPCIERCYRAYIGMVSAPRTTPEWFHPDSRAATGRVHHRSSMLAVLW